jgi:uncharacterized protein YaeQ
VILYTYGGRAVPLWWEKVRGKVSRFDNLTVVDLPPEATEALARLADRNMSLQCTLQDGEISIGNDRELVTISPQWLFPTA